MNEYGQFLIIIMVLTALGFGGLTATEWMRGADMSSVTLAVVFGVVLEGCMLFVLLTQGLTRSRRRYDA